MTRSMCRHCGVRPVNRPRGLCWADYYRPGVRDLYPSTSKYATRGVGNGCRNAPLPATPTAARPGTPEKLAVIKERASLGLALFHPDDATLPATDLA